MFGVNIIISLLVNVNVQLISEGKSHPVLCGREGRKTENSHLHTWRGVGRNLCPKRQQRELRPTTEMKKMSESSCGWCCSDFFPKYFPGKALAFSVRTMTQLMYSVVLSFIRKFTVRFEDKHLATLLPPNRGKLNALILSWEEWGKKLLQRSVRRRLLLTHENFR